MRRSYSKNNCFQMPKNIYLIYVKTNTSVSYLQCLVSVYRNIYQLGGGKLLESGIGTCTKKTLDFKVGNLNYSNLSYFASYHTLLKVLYLQFINLIQHSLHLWKIYYLNKYVQYITLTLTFNCITLHKLIFKTLSAGFVAVCDIINQGC